MWIHCAIIALLVFGCVAPTATAAENYAFLVAVQDYDQKQLRSLTYSRADVLALAEKLKTIGFQQENIEVLHDDVHTLANRNFVASAVRIRSRLEVLLGVAEADDTVVIAFTGHGVQKKGERLNYFCPCDADLEDLNKPPEQRTTLISLQEIYEMLVVCPARQKLLLVDACRNDPQSPLAKSRQNVELESVTRPQTEAVPHGIVALFSCAAGQQSYEHPDLQHGVFMHHVLKAWEPTSDRDGDGKVSYDEFAKVTADGTKQFVRLKLEAVQTPANRMEVEGAWYLPLAAGTALPSRSPEPAGQTVQATFHVREGDKNGPLAAGVNVELFWRENPSAAPQSLGSALSDDAGKALVAASLSPSQQAQGTFSATLTHSGRIQGYQLPGFPQIAAWTVYAPRGVTAADEITNSIGMKLKLIPAGEFMMGSPEREADRSPGETQRRVKLSQPYYMGMHEVTQGQWQAVMGTTPWSESHVKAGADYPVTNVSWGDAAMFCLELTKREQTAGRLRGGQAYQLPTEAQWEHACRGGKSTAFSFGDDAEQLGDHAWFGNNAWNNDKTFTHPVGQKKPNPLGLFDMHGNVSEWCQDWFEIYPGGPATDPTGPALAPHGVKSGRVVRGGSGQDEAQAARAARRQEAWPSGNTYIGFRVSLHPR